MPPTDDRDAVLRAAERLIARANTVEDQDRVAVWASDVQIVTEAARAAVEREAALVEALNQARVFVQRVQQQACCDPYCRGGCLAQAAGDLLDTIRRAATAPQQPE